MPLGKYANGRSWHHKRGPSPLMGYPLRKVTDDGIGLDPNWPDRDVDALECGHFLGMATDMIGRRFPARRRCWKCKKRGED